MVLFKFGKPAQKIEDYVKSSYIPRNLKKQILQDDPYGKTSLSSCNVEIKKSSIETSYDIDYSFDGSILEYYNRESNSFDIAYEPYSELSSKGSIAGSDFSICDSQLVTKIFKLSRNFTCLGTSFNQASFLNCISADCISSIQTSALAGLRNLEDVCLPNLLSANDTSFANDFRLKTARFDRIQAFSGTVFRTCSYLKKLDLGDITTRSTLPSISVNTSSLLGIFFSMLANVEVYGPVEFEDNGYCGNSEWTTILDRSNVSYAGQ